MRSLATAAALLALLAGEAASADRSADAVCLSSGDTSDAVTSKRVIAPAQAIRIARRVAPDAELLRAALCGSAEALVYVVVLLQRNGRLARVAVDAGSGVAKRID